MAKQKHIIYRLHKIQVHPNRWLIWAVAYLIIIAIGMVGYIKVSDVNFDTDLSGQVAYVASKTYTNYQSGYSLRYPGDWAIESDEESTLTFGPADSTNEGVSVSVIGRADENSLRKGLTIKQEEPIRVDGDPAVKIINQTSAQEIEAVVLAPHGQNLYVIRGRNDLVNKLLLTFNFTF